MRNIFARVSSLRQMSTGEITRLIDSYAGPLILYARQWSDSPEDVVQDAFVKLVSQRRPPDDRIAWLFRVVRNGALDSAKLARRRQRRESVVARPVRWFVQPAIEGLDAETAVTALQRLPPEQREVIVARLWGGLSFEQIAEVGGCSASTAFRRYSAGIDVLRQALGVICPDESTNS